MHGARHSRERDAAAISYHYDVSNDFYRLMLGPSMTYSCAVWEDPSVGLEAAQAAKHELICQKLRPAAGDAPAGRRAAGGGRWRCTPPSTTASRSSA